jgi:predicted DNA-binding protein
MNREAQGPVRLHYKVTTRVTPDVMERIREAAGRESRTIAGWVRKVILDRLGEVSESVL